MTVERFRALGRVLCVIAVGGMLAGCDKCGNWFGIFKFEAVGTLDACRTPPPPPPQ